MPRADGSSWMLGVWLVAACGANVDGDGSTDGADTSASDPTAASDPTTDPTTGNDALTHGTVKLEIRRGESQASNPALGTARVELTMQYRECLTDFYEQNPSWRQTGPDGELVFGGAELGGEGWLDRLCAPGAVASLADCSVDSIAQTLDAVKQLTVTYLVNADLENRTLLFGPMPTAETAGCADPIVRVGSMRGLDPEGAVLWTIESFSPTEAITNQAGAITVRIAATD